MTSSYRDPSVMAALAYQAEQEKQRKEQEQPSFLDIAGRTALGLGAATLAGVGIARGLRRNAASPVTVQDLSANAEEVVRRAARSSSTPPPSRPSIPAGVARQQATEEFTRQARTERPGGVQQVSIRDLGPTWRTPSAAENKATLAFLQDVVLPTEQALTQPRLPAGIDVSQTNAALGDLTPRALPAARSTLTDYLTQKGYVESVSTGTPYSVSDVAELAKRPAVESAGDAGDRFIQEYQQLAENQSRADRRVQAGLREREMQIRGAGERALAELQQESLVAKQQARTGFNVDQAINALDSGEDQQTGRIKLQLQRNEDLDLGQIEVLEDVAEYNRIQGMEQDEPINRVASQLSDGLPLDQAEEAGTAAQKFVAAELVRQRPSREPLLDIENKMYDLVATAAQTGLKLDTKRALSILTNPNVELTFDEMKAFQSSPELGKLALRGQSYAPGQQQTGRIMEIRSAASGTEQAKGMGERLKEEGYLSRPVGRGELRGLSALNREALETGIEEIPVSYEETLISTPETLEKARQDLKKAQGSLRTSQMNKLFTSSTEPGLLSLRTTGGVVPITTTEFKRTYRPAAIEALEEAAQIQSGTLEYPDLIKASYGSTSNPSLLAKTIGSRFAEKLAQQGLPLESNDPYAAHTLASLAMGGTSGSLALSDYAKRAGRMESRGLTSRTGQVAGFVPGPRPEEVSEAVATSTYPYQGRGTYTSRGIVQPAEQPVGGQTALDILERQGRRAIESTPTTASPLAPGGISSFYAEGYENPAQSYLAGKLEEQKSRLERQQQQSSRNLRRFGLTP